MKTKNKKSLHKLRLDKVKISRLTSNEKNQVVGGATARCDAQTGIPCIALHQNFQ